MTTHHHVIERRQFLKAGAAAGAMLSAPAILRAQSPAPVKIGILNSLTGTFSLDGRLAKEGVELAVEEINANGGIRSLGGAPLEIVLGDARSSPEVAVQEVEQLHRAQVCAIVGGFASPICLAISQAASRYDIPYMTDLGLSEQVLERGLANTFRFAPGFNILVRAAIDNLVRMNEAAGRPVKTISMVHEDGLYGTNLARMMGNALSQQGFDILESITHPTPARDMTNVALRIRSLKPDLIVRSSYYGETVLLMRTLVQQRVRVKGVYCVVDAAASNPRFIREFPQAAENTMNVTHWHDPRKPKALALRKKVEDRGGDWTYNALLNYSIISLLADAIERAGSRRRTDIIEAIAQSTFEGHIMPFGPTKFVKGQNQGAAPVITQVQSGDIKVIFPEAFSDAKPNYPLPV